MTKVRTGQTAEEIKRFLGNPLHEDHSPDGRFTYVYQWQNKENAADRGYMTFLFNKDNKLVRHEQFVETK